MEDQIAENMKAGMDHEKAEKEAVRDMGDPVETGISLDSIHRPQAAWKLLGMIIFISIAGVLIHAGISGKASENAAAGSDRYVFQIFIHNSHLQYKHIGHCCRILFIHCCTAWKRKDS